MPIEPEITNRAPHGFDDGRRGVVGVQGGAPGLGPLLVSPQQLPQVRADVAEPVIVLVKDMGYRTPARPASQSGLFVSRGPALFSFTVGQDAKGGQVGVELGLGARRGKVVLADRPERRWAPRRRFSYAVWMAKLTLARSSTAAASSGSSSGFSGSAWNR